MGRIGCVLQPTFMPWLGWFDLVDQCDVVVILDDVGFSKQSWQQRNRIRTPDGLDFLSVPVKSAGRLGQPINEVELAGDRFEAKALGRIRDNYSRAPHFALLFDSLALRLHEGVTTERLLALNMGLIDWARDHLAVRTTSVMASDMRVHGVRGEKVARLCEALGVSSYLSPMGAAGYLAEDVGAFDALGIEVRLHNFEHPQYRQCFDPFLSHASFVDLLFNEGSKSASILRGGRRDSLALPRDGGVNTR